MTKAQEATSAAQKTADEKADALKAADAKLVQAKQELASAESNLSAKQAALTTANETLAAAKQEKTADAQKASAADKAAQSKLASVNKEAADLALTEAKTETKATGKKQAQLCRKPAKARISPPFWQGLWHCWPVQVSLPLAGVRRTKSNCINNKSIGKATLFQSRFLYTTFFKKIIITY